MTMQHDHAIILTVTWKKSEKKKSTNYDLDFSTKSSFLTATLDHKSVMRTNGFYNTRNTLQYNIPKIAKNTIKFSGKFSDKSKTNTLAYSLRR